MNFGIQNKVALVQGASSGLGYAAALELAKEGCRLAICLREKIRIQSADQSFVVDGGLVKGLF